MCSKLKRITYDGIYQSVGGSVFRQVKLGSDLVLCIARAGSILDVRTVMNRAD